MRRFHIAFTAVSLALACAPAQAEVVAKSDIGFVSRNTVEVAAKPEAVWAALVLPSGWWNSQHTYSADAANLSLAPVAGGCFCEKLPAPAGAPAWAQPGAVEHMRVINIEPGKAMRLSGGLGPLQSEAVDGVLTITLKPTDKGTRILFEYVVGGYMRYTTDQIGPLVDKVMLEQLGRLALKVNPVAVGRGNLAGPPVPAGPPAPGGKAPAVIAPAPAATVPAPVPPARPVPPAPKAAAPAAQAPKPVAAPVPEIDEAADKAKGAEAAAALDALAAPKFVPVPVPVTAPQPVPAPYTTRTLLMLEPSAGKQWVDEARSPVAVSFGTAAGARLAAGLAPAADPANKGKVAICSCTGRMEVKDGKPVFAIIDAAISFR
jgi:uncharacterized protein YndB with AHSA1/START domain